MAAIDHSYKFRAIEHHIRQARNAMGNDTILGRPALRGRRPAPEGPVERRVKLHRQPQSVVAYFEPLIELARQG